MDEFERRLKRDANRIDVEVSDALDRRIAASLHGVEQQRPQVPRPVSSGAGFWWLSSLTGAAVAVLVFAVVARWPAADEPPPATRAASAGEHDIDDLPVLEWRAEPAMLTAPLQRELEDLQADIEKAERKIRDDIGL